MFFMPEENGEAVNSPVAKHPDNEKMSQIVDGLRKLQELIQ
jgi:hypothetical protein